MYLNDFSDNYELNELNELSQSFWDKIKKEIEKPIQTGIETAKKQARERIEEGATRFIQEKGSQIWDKVFGQQKPAVDLLSPSPATVPVSTTEVKPFTIFGLKPLELGLITIGLILLIYFLRNRK